MSKDIIIKLKPTEKIISYIKKWNKDTILIGFKLLVDVSEEILIDNSKKMIIDYNCDYVVANDLKNINKYEHKALIIDKNLKYKKANNKQEISKIIFDIYKGN